jgi:hypothetical protein
MLTKSRLKSRARVESEQVVENYPEEIIPFARIPGLKIFYASGSITVGSLITVPDEILATKKLSEDSRGQWATEQFLSAAKSLFVEDFVISLDSGGCNVPVIAPQDFYVEAHLQMKRQAIVNLEKTFEMRNWNLDRSMRDVQVAKRALQGMEEIAEIRIGGSDHYAAVLEPVMTRRSGKTYEVSEAKEESEEATAEVRERISVLEEEYAKKYRQWSKDHTELQKDTQTIEDWKSEARKNGVRQYSDDTDAHSRLMSSLLALKKFLGGLVKKVPAIDEVIRSMGDESSDPYEEGDMRRVYANLVSRYRQNNEMGKCTTIMAGMREVQGSRSLVVFMRVLEEFFQPVSRLGVKEIALNDLVAMIAISGMNEATREEFLKVETALALTLTSLDVQSGGA